MAATIDREKYKHIAIGVFTSGGDSQGMNAALRAVVRVTIFMGAKAFFIKEGYQGMVDGAEYIKEASWSSVSKIIHQGGTIIGSARCKEFRERSGFLKAAKNLVKHGICYLVVIGGDGSLTGADEFRRQWSSLLDELQRKGEITAEEAKRCPDLKIAGLVGSIDNDFCGTDMTIGVDSALHRIMESVDAIVTTAFSHQRTFIMEVMGRHCGYLALATAIASEADYVFIPESPPLEDWQDRLCKKLGRERKGGKRMNVIIVSEGALDKDGKPITSEMIKKIVVDKVKHDTRVTVLGHVQRGGAPSAFDRVLGSRMGAEAALALLNADENFTGCVIALEGNVAVKKDLMECVKLTKAVGECLKNKDWEGALKGRGKGFVRNWESYKLISKSIEPVSTKPGVIGIIHVGSPCCGINAAVRSIVRMGLLKGHRVIGIQNGFDGLMEGQHRELFWNDVTLWNFLGGAELGACKTFPSTNMAKVAEKLLEIHIHSLIIIGGFKAYQAAFELLEARSKYAVFQIPILLIPATISNNVPGSDFSIGADTSLNCIMEALDRIRQSAQGTKRRLFIVEVMGEYCGYLATVASLAAGADATYIPEFPPHIEDVLTDIETYKKKMKSAHVNRGLFIRTEYANRNFTADFIEKLANDESKGEFSVRSNNLGHLQQGGDPSPFDRSFASKIGNEAVHWVIEAMEKPETFFNVPESVCVLGLTSESYKATPIQSLREKTNWKQSMPTNDSKWWLVLRELNQLLGKYPDDN